MRWKGKLSKENTGYLFIAPYFIIYFIFSLYPVLYTLRLSFFQWDGISDAVFVGIKNYKMLLHDELFIQSIFNTVIITLLAGLLQIGFGLAFAYVLTQRFIRTPDLFRGIFYFPNLVTAVSLGVLFQLMFDWQGGFVNHILTALNITSQPVDWFSSSIFAKSIIIFILWFQYFGYYTVIFTAGMKGISTSILEAAAIDGSSSFKTFSKIVLPLLQPIITYSAITVIIGGMQMFDIPYMIGKTRGDPGNSTLTIVNYMYNASFKNFNYGYGSAVSYALFLLIILFSILYMRKTMEKEAGLT